MLVIPASIAFFPPWFVWLVAGVSALLVIVAIAQMAKPRRRRRK